ncbi:MAG: D-alanine--D-alanine ligase [Clostridia bacterium]|nr:D-alanine--D-alanine ligase [Lachnospiraceae bacterium]NCB99585.1 D-alanine--D-alanine ligase [Clostridia bacterium]NCD01789.1 D-alanine--D-alanine ligase [Clostridia bacterium]
MSNKLTVAVVFGGQSSEHEVSCVSGVTIMKALDLEKYEVILVGITKEGQWLLTESIADVESGAWRESKAQAIISPDAQTHGLIIIEDGNIQKKKIDVIFPVLHGMYGEDGTIQGLFELCQIPYVGCGVLASSVSMDKWYTKIVVDDLGIRQAKYVPISHIDMHDLSGCVEKVERTLEYPVFVKPSKAGSSVGVNKAHNREELIDALNEAIKHDIHILVEETIVGREIECAVLGGYMPEASDVGEVLSAEDFYSYDAKYNNQASKTDLHPVFPEGKLDEVRKDAVEIFKALDGFGCARVDFFMEKETNEIVFNEINTLPGFTSISMYPMLWNEKGVDNRELVDRMIQHAFERYVR